jgi:hypothetical protein
MESTPAPATPARPQLDYDAVLAGLQQQIDDLTAAVEAHQRTIDQLPAGGPGHRTASEHRPGRVGG